MKSQSNDDRVKQFNIKASGQELLLLKSRAAESGRTVADFVRGKLFREDDGVPSRIEALSDQVTALGETVVRLESMLTEVTKSLVHLKRLGGAAVASGALLRDSGKEDVAIVQKRIGHHVRTAIAAAPGIVKASAEIES